MEYLPGTCPIYPDLVNLGWVISQIFNVTKNMTTPVLTNKISKICTQTHIGHRRLVITPRPNWEPFKEDEAFSIEYLVTDCFQQNG